MEDKKSFNRDTRGDDYKSNPKESTILREVEELMKSGSTEYEAWQRIKSKYGNNPELFEKIMDAYKDKLHRIYKKARKFKQLLYDRYAGLNIPYGEMLKKAKKYQKKYKFTDDEFNMFTILAMTDKSNKYTSFSLPSTKMAKALGYDAILASTSRISVKAEEASIIEEIVNKYGETKPLHAQIVLQTLTYRDSAPEALSGCFSRDKHNPFSYIHPVVAALFIPKINLLDEQMLIANIGYIVKCKANEQPIMTKPDFDLYWAMITDPNDLECTMESAAKDLRNRFNLQTQLWDAVMQLRLGNYYYKDNAGLVRFMQALEQCRNIIHDAPDLTYVKDEGTILRRLLSAFSLYPTYVSINKLWGLLVGTQYGFPSSPLEASGFSNITTVPMITLRLPLNVTGNSKAVSLEESLTQPQWFVENKVIVPKALQIIHSRDVIFFYVGRRYQTINISRLNIPYNFTNLPMTVTGWEALNEHPVNAPITMNIMNDTFELKSVVLVEKTCRDGRNLIVGSSALIAAPLENYQKTYLMYDPQGAGEMLREGEGYVNNKPLTVIPGESPFNTSGNLESFTQRARTRGTIFMYKKLTQYPSPFFPCVQVPTC